LIETRGRTIAQIADEQGVGQSALAWWKRIYREVASTSEPHVDLTQERTRLRKENSVPRQEREILKRAATFFAKEASQ
tara:strand:- start:55876 stop:56109 length:234 start_codon:yes stop_codon:yes gene_type:complete